MRNAGTQPIETSPIGLLRTPIGSSAVGAAIVSLAAWAIFGGWRWLPIPLAVLTVGLLAECVRTDKPTISARMSIATAAMIVGLLAAVTMSSDGLLGKPAVDGTAEVALAASATTTPDVDVEGASLTRADFERLDDCEAALRSIATTIAATPGFDDQAGATVASGGDDAGLRLRRCEARLESIALSLQP
ncbi:MAG: hypothetical protein GX868_10475 [Actinobacteria bacterium]|nr:hypothetical protein [Actinomycetota bacterium]